MRAGTTRRVVGRAVVVALLGLGGALVASQAASASDFSWDDFSWDSAPTSTVSVSGDQAIATASDFSWD